MKNSDIPMAFDPQETEFLAENRKSMSNDEMKKFLEQESELQKKTTENRRLERLYQMGRKIDGSETYFSRCRINCQRARTR